MTVVDMMVFMEVVRPLASRVDNASLKTKLTMRNTGEFK